MHWACRPATGAIRLNRTARTCLERLLAVLVTACFAACGGGGGGGGGPAPPTDPGDTTPPVVTAVNIDNGATNVQVTAVVQAGFSEAIGNVGATTFRLIDVFGDNVAGTVTVADNAATFTPSANLRYQTTYFATVTTGVTDLAGNALAETYSWSFTTCPRPDTTPPTVTSTTPTGGASDVLASTNVRVTFSEAVSNVGPATFQLRDGDGVAVPGVVTHGANTATFTPTASLAHLATYTATVTTGVTDLAGNTLAADFSWSFTTGEVQDTTPPAVTSTTPTGGASGVAVSARVQAAFSEAVKNVSASTFQVRAGATSVAGSVTLVGSTATFTPSADLAYGTTYTATLTTEVTDLASNALAADHGWSFTTG
ncbi:MAG: Ig-like domain-containing protein, partial [Deltaproteobacteria bacterium]